MKPHTPTLALALTLAATSTGMSADERNRLPSVSERHGLGLLMIDPLNPPRTGHRSRTT